MFYDDADFYIDYSFNFFVMMKLLWRTLLAHCIGRLKLYGQVYCSYFTNKLYIVNINFIFLKVLIIQILNYFNSIVLLFNYYLVYLLEKSYIICQNY